MRLELRLGAAIRQLRMDRDISQEELADRSGVSVDSVRRLERGELSPSLSTLMKLTHGLQVRLSTLFARLDHEAHPRASVAEQLCDLLSFRSPKEVERVQRVLEAMLARSPESDEG